MATGGRSLRKVQEIPSGYDAGRYRTERLHIAARDGTQVWGMRYVKVFARPGRPIECLPWTTVATFRWRPDLRRRPRHARQPRPRCDDQRQRDGDRYRPAAHQRPFT